VKRDAAREPARRGILPLPILQPIRALGLLIEGCKGLDVRMGHINGKGKKREVIAPHVQKTEKKFKEKGLKWPPQKKSKGT
jgi:hypothetical protein